jgi:HEAT repeat protein
MGAGIAVIQSAEMLLFLIRRSLASDNISARLKAIESLLDSRPAETMTLLSAALSKAIDDVDSRHAGDPRWAQNQDVRKKDEVDVTTQLRIVEALGALSDPGAADVLGKTLRAVKRSTVLMAAARSLAKLRTPAAVDGLVHALSALPNQHACFGVKAEVAIALAQIGDQRAVAPLTDLRDRLTKEYESRSANPPSDPTPAARKDFEEDLAEIVHCGSAITKALSTFKFHKG